jgi:hypothetical protein
MPLPPRTSKHSTIRNEILKDIEAIQRAGGGWIRIEETIKIKNNQGKVRKSGYSPDIRAKSRFSRQKFEFKKKL